jgi:hypothetical protein
MVIFCRVSLQVRPPPNKVLPGVQKAIEAMNGATFVEQVLFESFQLVLTTGTRPALCQETQHNLKSLLRAQIHERITRGPGLTSIYFIRFIRILR